MVPRVTVLGSCRVYEPFKRLADDGRIELANRGVYGYVHYTKEVVQQLAVMRGEQRIPTDLAPYITHKRLPPGTEDDEYVEIPENDLSETDLLVVEVSSLKEIDYKGYYLQINRLRDKLISVHPQLKEWWKGIYDRDAKIDRRALREGLPKATERRLVTFTTVTLQDRRSMVADLNEIASRFDGPILFVSHFNTPTLKGARIPIRDTLVEWVEEAAADLEQPFFNPAALVEAFGLPLALEDMAHYTPAFERAIAEYFYARMRTFDGLTFEDEAAQASPPAVSA